MFAGLIFVVTSGLVNYIDTHELCLRGTNFCHLKLAASFGK